MNYLKHASIAKGKFKRRRWKDILLPEFGMVSNNSLIDLI